MHVKALWLKKIAFEPVNFKLWKTIYYTQIKSIPTRRKINTFRHHVITMGIKFNGLFIIPRHEILSTVD